MAKKCVLFVCTLAFLLLESGCQDSSQEPIIVAAPPKIPPSRALTLSQQQLVSLDWNNPGRGGARITGKRIVPEQGVEFDIYFPSNSPGYCRVDYVSSGQGGMGALNGADIRGYETFTLMFTLVSINGQTAEEMKEKVVVGALIGLTGTGRFSDYKPVTLSLLLSEKSTIATTPIQTNKIYEIGFHIHMLNPQDWKPTGTVLTLRVDPVGEAGIVPYPLLDEGVQE
ncbi:MAG: hypothetical protein GWN67_10500 [Phycisphaerae bacterium]|nr:hypothetical protein [Phycisphaerae bacterium]NIR64484.1 hypothetical protein [candidate division Zixibacteria bacterium]NIP52621.1 hypothetical protein [Phycisphaerae bacterium]NIS52973.1 hypothetical protein [Phycisphaerae bacterium]NIU10431.1 hypothetical protein [Phycisphaerae bacterium]